MNIKKEAKNCWEFWDCPKEITKKCPAYITGSGRECWLVAGNFSDKLCPKVAKKQDYCCECRWFMRLNPDFALRRKEK